MYEKQVAFANRIKAEKPALCLDMIADLHQVSPMKSKVFENCLQDVFHRNVEHLAILGDVTNNGFPFQWNCCLKQLKEYPLHYYIPMGNHDTNTFQQKQLHIQPLYKELVLQDAKTLYFDRMVHGVHLYVLNPQAVDKTNAQFHHDQLQWLENKLQNEKSDTISIVLCHHPLFHTHQHTDEVMNTVGFQSDEIKRILKQHPHVLFCSAHIHHSYPMCSVSFDEHIAFLDVPSFSRISYGKKIKHIGYHLKVYHDFIYLKTRDYKNQQWITSNEYILDFKNDHVYSFDQDFLSDTAVQQKSSQN